MESSPQKSGLSQNRLDRKHATTMRLYYRVTGTTFNELCTRGFEQENIEHHQTVGFASTRSDRFAHVVNG